MSNEESGKRLAIIWSSAEPDVAAKVCFMYASNAKLHGWFDEVLLVIWGPSAQLVSRDGDLQQGIADLQAADVIVQACKQCSDSYGVSEQLEAACIEVKYMGLPLTEMLQSDWKVLTF
jgi:hypothetical protein